MGPSSKSFAHVKRAHRVINEVGIRFNRFFVVGGYGFDADPDPSSLSALGLPYLGKIAADPEVARMVLQGKNLLDTPADSAAYRSVAGIVGKVLGKE